MALEPIVIAAFLAFCRIGACFMVIPGFASARVPPQIRLFVAVGATGALLVHLWDAILPYASRRNDALFLLILSELLIGVLIGVVARLYMLALQFIGAAVAMSMGFNGMASTTIEEAEPQAALTTLISFSALLILFVLDFHHEIVRALVASYRIAPPEMLFDPQGALVDIADTVSESFFVALRLGSPFIAYAIVVNLAIGLVNKLTPQIPVYFIAMPFMIAGGLILLYFGIDEMLSLFADGFVSTTIGR